MQFFVIKQVQLDITKTRFTVVFEINRSEWGLTWKKY